MAAAAAAVLLAVGVGWWGVWNARRAGLAEGRLVTTDGRELTDGQPIPAGETVTAATTARSTFDDGTTVRLDPGATVAMRQWLTGGARVDLREGRIEANVAPQPRDRKFVVSTALGEIVVVGTRFSVDCRREPVVVFLGDGEGQAEGESRTALLVTVDVFEGRVLVRNGFDEVEVGAGEVARLRQSQAVIDVTRRQTHESP